MAASGDDFEKGQASRALAAMTVAVARARLKLPLGWHLLRFSFVLSAAS
jgi:hypothetical protein